MFAEFWRLRTGRDSCKAAAPLDPLIFRCQAGHHMRFKQNNDRIYGKSGSAPLDGGLTQPWPASASEFVGLVQGVGFRPMVSRVAGGRGVQGNVLNAGEGVPVNAWGSQATA